MQYRRKTAAVVATIAALTLAAHAAAPQRTHEITVEDYFTIHMITDCAVSPGGQYVAFVQLGWGETDAPRSTDLWVVEVASHRLQRLTFDPANDASPQWGADDGHLYFLTKRNRGDKKPPYDGSQQVWVTGVHPGEPFPITRVKGGVTQYELSKDGRTLYYSKDGDEVVDEWKDLRKRYSDIEFGNGPLKYTEIWKLDLETWREEQVAAPKRVIVEFKVAPDESRIAMITTPDDRAMTREGWSRIDVYDTKTKGITTLPDKLFREEAPSPYGWLADLAWSSDSSRLAWTVDFDGYPGEIIVAQWSGAEPTLWRLQRPGEASVAGNLHWRPGSADLCFSVEDHARERIFCIADIHDGHQGQPSILTTGDIVAQSFDFVGNHLAFVLADPQQPGDLYMKTADALQAEPTRLTNINPQVDTWKLPQLSLVKWTSADGVEVEGVLELPPDYKAEQGPLPLVVEIHGGPTDATRFYLQYWIYGRTLMPAKGYALLSPNYRGSTGYGDKFLTDLIGHENDVDVQDILAGIAAMIERGVADPNRLGVIGWSNGGFLTNVLIARCGAKPCGTGTPPISFKAASTGAGVVDQLMQWGLEDTPCHVINYMRGLPWEQSEAYIKASAAYQLGNVTTPTLIHVGEKDTRVPAAHCRTLYRGLKDFVHVPTVLLVYPGAGHGLTVYNHRKAKMEWDLAWFDKYLLGKTAAEPAKP